MFAKKNKKKKRFKSFKGCLSQILLGSSLNTFSHILQALGHTCSYLILYLTFVHVILLFCSYFSRKIMGYFLGKDNDIVMVAFSIYVALA